MVSFVKYEGLGNDFLVVDVRHRGPGVTPEQAVTWCDRRRGVGADGVLLVGPSARADARMEVLNSDGTRAEMCGNGLRCVADHLLERTSGALIVETDAGLLRCEVQAAGWVVTDIGRGELLFDAVESGTPDLPDPGVGISMGNPHLVFHVNGPTRSLAQEHGPRLTHHELFPAGVNVGFAWLRDGGLELTVYERGAGLTLACGTGAAAAALATWRRDPRAPQPLTVELPGGALVAHPVEAEGEGLGGARLEGPARRVFEGRIE